MASALWFWRGAIDRHGARGGELIMCTVSIVPTHGTLRLVCNRDERRTRPPALPPERRTIGGRSALYPIDPVCGGTWIGVNDARIALVLLNRSANGTARMDEQEQSRGTIIPELLRHDELHGVVKDALRIDATRFALFRLIAIQRSRIAVMTSDGHRLSLSYPISNVPLMFTSSSLGDSFVETPRRELFEQMVLGTRCTWACGQDRFHRHYWKGARDISVVMNRPDARTVSRTVVEIGPRANTLTYAALDSGKTTC